jgi:hypothetical protein
MNLFKEQLKLSIKKLEMKKKTNGLSTEEENKLQNLFKTLKIGRKIEILSNEEKKLYFNISHLYMDIMHYKMGSKSIFFAKEHEKNEEWYKMSVSVHNNYEKELRKTYKRIKNCPKKTFDKIMKIQDFSESYKKYFDESMNFIEKFILKNDK